MQRSQDMSAICHWCQHHVFFTWGLSRPASAMQALLASAQAAGDEKPLRNAFLQLDGMLRLELVQLGGAA